MIRYLYILQQMMAGLASLVVAASCVSGTAFCDVVYLKSGQIVYGLYEGEFDGNVHFRQRMEERGVYESRVFQRSDVLAFVVTIDTERILALQPGDWKPWRDLAEELSVQVADPEARDLAFRLYLILARNAPQPLREAAFRGAIGISEHYSSSQWSRRIRILAWQESGGMIELPDLQDAGDKPAADPAGGQSFARQLASAIHDYRTGDRGALGKLARDEEFAGRMSPYAWLCTAEQFKQIASRETPDFGELSILLRLELAALAAVDGKAPREVTRDSPWSVLVQQNRTAPAPADFAAFEGIDPLAVEYRNGTWQRPD